MEVICRIMQVGQLTQRTFTDRKNQTQVMNEREFSISCGASSFIGKMFGQAATNFNGQDPDWTNVVCVCNFDVVSRPYMSDRGETYFTDVRINRIEKM